MEELRIKYDRGKMVVILNNFFPTSRARLKKLLKVIDLDYEHSDELIEQLKQFFSEQIPVYKAEFESNGRKYLECQQLSADTGRMVKSKKRPSGVRLSDEELKQEKERLIPTKKPQRNTWVLQRNFSVVINSILNCLNI